MLLSATELLRDLRAAAEPTRLRLLAILAMGEFSVTDLTRILGQSQPRVSRHLKLLGEAGLLQRYREQHWIYYRVPADGAGAGFVRSLLAMIDTTDPQLGIDRDRTLAILAERELACGGDPGARVDRGAMGERDLAAVLAGELGTDGLDALLYVGRSPASALAVLGPRARRAVGLCGSLAEVRRARANLHSRGLAHSVVYQGDLQALPPGTGSFDLIVLDRALLGPARPEAVLNESARLLSPGGRVLLVEHYDELSEQLESGAHAIEAMREWIVASGLLCTRLKPMDIQEHHLLLAVASAARPGASRAAA